MMVVVDFIVASAARLSMQAHVLSTSIPRSETCLSLREYGLGFFEAIESSKETKWSLNQYQDIHTSSGQ